MKKSMGLMVWLAALALACIVGCGGVDYSPDYKAVTNDSGQVSMQLSHELKTETGAVGVTTNQVFDFALLLLQVFGGAAVAASVPVVRKIAKPLIPILDMAAFNVAGARNKTE